MSLVIPRRRVWVKIVDGGFEIAALARGDDPMLDRVIANLSNQLKPAKPKKSTKSEEESK
jgi:cytochrome c biogenesis protein